MGVFKEHAHAFEAVEKRQLQIFNDAADYGYPYNTENPPQEIKDLIHFVNELKDTKLCVNRETWGEGTANAGVSLKIQIGWEIDEGMECGTEYNISFNKLRNHSSLLHRDCNAFISVNSRAYEKPREDHPQDDLKANFRSWEEGDHNKEDAEDLFKILKERHPRFNRIQLRKYAYEWLGVEYE